MSEQALQPITPATPGRQDRHESSANDINDLYRQTLKKECERRNFALRIGLSTIPFSVATTTGLGLAMGMSFMGLALLAIIGLSCSPGLAVAIMTAHKLFRGRALKKRVLKQAQMLGINDAQARFLWKAVCQQLDSLDRESLGRGDTFKIFNQCKNPELMKLIEKGVVPWDDKSLLPQRLPGLPN